MVAASMKILAFLVLVPSVALAQGGYVNFEGAQTHPIRLSPDGTRLFAVNTPDARVSVFDLSNPNRPRLIAEIPVGIEPVSVHPRTEDEAWVVNQVSDSVSIVSVSRGIVTDTITVGDEPMDVVFASGAAFVSVSRANRINVYNVLTHTLMRSIRVFGGNPRALAVSPDGGKIYAAFALSGNKSTILPLTVAPPQPPPTNAELPAPPQTGLIVDVRNPLWSSFVRHNMPDNDVVEIDANLLRVNRYFSGVGTVNLGLAVRPTTGELFVANTDARNLIRFEPNVRGHFIDSRITRITPSGLLSFQDLNPGIDYGVLPNPQAKATALSQPTDIVFTPRGRSFYVASFGTDRVALVDVDGTILSRIEIGPVGGSTGDPRDKRGPRGLALLGSGRTLYVLNRISNTIAVVDALVQAVVREIPVGAYDPTPAVIRNGRGFLYDAKLSGNGTASCAACHVDADMDKLAWDLGDPGGRMQVVFEQGFPLLVHPMKGPMVTQTLRGLKDLDPLHWRGDRADFRAFNPAFDKLMGEAELPDADMNAYAEFIETIAFQPNPNQLLDRSLPAGSAAGDPRAGQNTFLNEFYKADFKCNTCHTADPGPGTNRVITPPRPPNQPEPLKVPHLRNIYQKQDFNNHPNQDSIDGFGMNSDGTMATLFQLLSGQVFENFANDTVRKLNLAAFLMCFDTGTAPAVGYSITATPKDVGSPVINRIFTELQGQAAVGNIDLVAKGTLGGQVAGLLYQPASHIWIVDRNAVPPLDDTQLLLRLALGDTLTFMGVPPGSGRRMGIDRDEDDVLDGDE